MIELRDVTKRYGDVAAVDGLTFTVQPGVVTGFLGPNGAGKTTTMRMILGLESPSDGQVLVDGAPFARQVAPMCTIGALLEPGARHPSRTARNHLRALARTHSIADRRVDEVLELVGLAAVARKRAGQFSLGMNQRLGIAAALLGDPRVIMLDEPVNGLDPEGIRWIRDLLRGLAAEGRTVFISSHLMSEMAQTAEHLIVVGRGRLIRDEPIDQILADAVRHVRVASPERMRLAAILGTLPGVTVTDVDGELQVTGIDAPAIGDLCAREGITLHALVEEQASLEDIFMDLTGDAVEYHGHAASNRHDGTPDA